MTGALHRTVRGPVRTRLRRLQAAAPVLRGRRTAGPPDFVGIGVQRCGTSWWLSLIESHPQVASLGLGAKELHFFDSFWARDLTERDIAEYHTHFLRSRGQQVGEWTPRYLYDPWALPALLRAAPHARLLVLLRDPVARFRSGLTHASKRSGTLSADAVTDAFERGLYAAQLARALELIPRARLLVLQFERCVADPRGLLAQTFDFLELPRVDVARNAAVNASPAPGTMMAPALLDEVRSRYRADVAQLSSMFPDDIDVALWTDPKIAG